MRNVKMLLFTVHDDGDFRYDLKSFPRDDDSYTTIIYLDNPSIDDVNTILEKVADEFESSFYSHRSLDDIKQKFVNRIRQTVKYNYFKGSNGEVKNNSCSIGCEDGNYSMSITLFTYKDMKIKFYNTKEEVSLVSIDPSELLGYMLI